MKGLNGRAGTQMQVVASWYQGWGPEARRSFLSTLVQVASGAGDGDLEAALNSLTLEGADEMLPCQIRLFKGWWGEWGHGQQEQFHFKLLQARTRSRRVATEKWNIGLRLTNMSG